MRIKAKKGENPSLVKEILIILTKIMIRRRGTNRMRKINMGMLMGARIIFSMGDRDALIL
jgi:hypothetical protein